jgi:hypothetical protein
VSQVHSGRRPVAKGPTIAAWIAAAWCAVIWVSALVAPAYSSETVHAGPQGEIRTESTRTLVEHEGGWILILLTLPLAITVVAALSSRTRLARWILIPTTAVLWLWILVTGFSVGLLYLPAGFAMFAALLMAVSNPPIRGDQPNIG